MMFLYREGNFKSVILRKKFFKSAIKFSKIRLRKWCKIFCPRTVNGDNDDDGGDDDDVDNCQTIFLNCFLQIIVPKPKILRTQKKRISLECECGRFRIVRCKTHEFNRHPLQGHPSTLRLLFNNIKCVFMLVLNICESLNVSVHLTLHNFFANLLHCLNLRILNR